MARPRLLAFLWGPLTAVALVASGCGGGAVEEAADGGAVAQPADEGVSPDSGGNDGGQADGGQDDGGSEDDGGSADDSSTDDGSTDDSSTDDGSTGGGGDDGSDDSGDGSSGGPDVDSGGAGARPAGVGDVEAFENLGGEFSGLQAGVAADCDGGRLCTLAEPVVVNGDPADLGGVEACTVVAIDYDPPSRIREDGREVFEAGATVITSVDCDPDGTFAGETEEGTTEEGTTVEGTTEEGTTEEGTTEEGTTEESTAEEGTTEEGATEEGTTEESTTEESTTEEGATDGTGEGTG